MSGPGVPNETAIFEQGELLMRSAVLCGISMAIQHVSGMRGGGFIVAISTRPKAAIFNVSD